MNEPGSRQAAGPVVAWTPPARPVIVPSPKRMLAMRYIVFDVGNVIVTADQERTLRRLRALGVSAADAVRFFDNDAYRAFSRGVIGHSEFVDRLRIGHLRAPSLSDDELVEAHDVHLTGCDTAVVDLLSRLPRDRTAVLTDTNPWQTRAERHLVELERYACRVLRSHETGYLKSDPDCFEGAAHALAAPAGELVLVDDRSTHVAAAEASGWTGIHFTDAGSLSRYLDDLGLLSPR